MHLHSPPSPRDTASLDWPWVAGFAALGPDYVSPQPLHPLPAPYWVAHSPSVANLLGLPAAWHTKQLAAMAGNCGMAGSQPVASVYSGHQFGVWAGQLGDGRATLLGTLQTPHHGRQELQLKGAGPTPYARGGDGRTVLRSSVREFLCSEAMHALGIPTTRALCISGSNAAVHRETRESAAVVARVAPSFIRFGHFEHFAARGQHQQLQTLADFVLAQYYPDCCHTAQYGGNRFAALFQAVCERTATLVAHWQAVGFCHGVMNTDNMSILGLGLDYGPFQFLDNFDPGHICNHSDTQGRYAFAQQPDIAYWNLFCLGQALLPLIQEPALASAALAHYPLAFKNAFTQQMRRKMGLLQAQKNDPALIDTTLGLLAEQAVDYTIFWRRLSDYVASTAGADLAAPTEPAVALAHAAVRSLFVGTAQFDAWLVQFTQRHASEQAAASAACMLRSNPQFILRNYLAEQAIRQAQNSLSSQASSEYNFSNLRHLQRVLETPFLAQPTVAAWAEHPPAWAAGIQISCSS